MNTFVLVWFNIIIAIVQFIGKIVCIDQDVETVTLPVCCCPVYRTKYMTIDVTVTNVVNETSVYTVTAGASATSTTNYTSTLSGPSGHIDPPYNYNDLINQFSHVLHEGVIGHFPNWDATNALVGVCGKNTDSLNAKYWAAVTTKYLRADSKFYPDPNLHPLCNGTFCIKVYGPKESWIFLVYDSFASPQSEEDITVARDAYFNMGFNDDINQVFWRFIKCPMRLGLV